MNQVSTRYCLAGFAPAILSAVLVSGCITSTSDEIRTLNTLLNEDESIVILTRKQVTGSESEAIFVDCVATRTASGKGAPNVMKQESFLDELYPWFEPRTAPTDIARMSVILNEERVADKIRDIGIRYVVWIDGTTERQQGAGNLQCAMATGGIPACFGMLSWDMKSAYEASVWDIRKGKIAGKLSQEASGTSFLPAIVIPIPFIAQTRSRSCQHLADSLKNFVTSETSS